MFANLPHTAPTPQSMRSVSLFAGFLALVLVLSGCRGMESERPPITPQQNMFNQERFNPQQKNEFFEDRRAMREPVSGTVARGFLREDTEFYEGRTEEGEFIEEMPITMTRELLERGQDRYDIYCAMCHGRAGDGEGIISVGDFGYTPATPMHEDYLIEIEDGHIYDVIANGIRTMPGYAQQIAVSDRWAITAYIRALQRSQRAGEDDIPAAIRAEIEQAPEGTQLDEEGEPAPPDEQPDPNAQPDPNDQPQPNDQPDP